MAGSELGTRADAELAIGGAEMVLDRAGREEEGGADLTVGLAGGDELADVALASGQLGGPFARVG